MDREFDRYECVILTSGFAGPQEGSSVAELAVGVLQESFPDIFLSYTISSKSYAIITSN